MRKFLRELGHEVKARLLPFLMLLDSRYLPLILVESYQSFTVYLWLWTNSPQTSADFVFSVLGGVGFTAIYVGVIAWAERREYSGWITGTAFTALVFGVAVAITHYWSRQGVLAVLHAGFPLTGFLYTLAMHNAPALRSPLKVVGQWLSSLGTRVRDLEQQLSTGAQDLAQMVAWLEQSRAETEQARADAEQQRAIVAQQDKLFKQARADAERMKAELEQRRAADQKTMEAFNQDRVVNEDLRRMLAHANDQLEQLNIIDKQDVVESYQRLLKLQSERMAAQQMGFSVASLNAWVREVASASSNGHRDMEVIG